MKFATNAFAHRATQVANLVLGAGLLAVLATALMPQTIRAQDLVLDNFSTGPGIVFNDVPNTTKDVTMTNPAIAGGSRRTILFSSASPAGNPFNQLTQVEYRPSKNPSVPSAMIWTTGFGNGARIDLVYGEGGTPMDLNLTPYNRLRVSFLGLAQGLNFNLLVYDVTNNYAELGCNIGPVYAPVVNGFPQFTVDFPISDLQLAMGGPADLSDIEAFDLVFQQANVYGSPSLVISGFSAIRASDPPGTITCGAT